MFRVALIIREGTSKGNNFETREECDIWILEIDEEFGVKKAMIQNKETGEREIINF